MTKQLRDKRVKRLKDRSNQLFELGMVFVGQSYVGVEDNTKDFAVHYKEMADDTDEEWDVKIQKFVDKLEYRRQKYN